MIDEFDFLAPGWPQTPAKPIKPLTELRVPFLALALYLENVLQSLETVVGPNPSTNLRRALVLTHRARLTGPPRRFHDPFEILLKR